jgi:peptide/nickel transport system substrate-binding protein
MNRSMIDRRGMLALGGFAAFAAGWPADARAEGGTRFVTATNSAYDTLDPHAVFDSGRIATRLNVYDCLVRWVDNPPKLQLWLADRSVIAPDGVTYTVVLKPCAQFHDGAEITADDVVFSMERILAMQTGAYGSFKGVIDPGKTKALDAHTAQFRLNQPFAVFTSVLSELRVIDSKLLREHDKLGDMGAAWLVRNEAGSGGFKLRRYDPVIGFQADRFTEHFAGFGKSNITTMELRVVLRAGDVFCHPQCASAVEQRQSAQGTVPRVRL